jgi:hypothetical protein
VLEAIADGVNVVDAVSEAVCEGVAVSEGVNVIEAV